MYSLRSRAEPVVVLKGTHLWVPTGPNGYLHVTNERITHQWVILVLKNSTWLGKSRGPVCCRSTAVRARDSNLLNATCMLADFAFLARCLVALSPY